jgi:hypothetical protein
VDHLENEGAAGAHLDLADFEAEPREGFEERALAVGLATQGLRATISGIGSSSPKTAAAAWRRL